MVSTNNILAVVVIVSVAVTFSNAERNEHGRLLILKSGDNSTVIEAREKEMIDAKIIKDALEENESNDKVELTLHNVNGKALELIVKWAQYHYDASHTEKEKDEFDEKYTKKDQATLIDLLASANYIALIELKELMCKAIASLIRGKTPDQLRETFGIYNDFLDETDDTQDETIKASSSSPPKVAESHKAKKHEGSTSKKIGDSPPKSSKDHKGKKHQEQGSTSKAPESSKAKKPDTLTTLKKEGTSKTKAPEGSKSKKSEGSTSKSSKDSKSKKHEGSTSKAPEGSKKKPSKN